MSKLIAASGTTVKSGTKIEGYWAGLFTTALKGRNVRDLIMGNETVAVAAGAPAAGAAPAAQKAAPKVEEPAEEEDFDMGGMFD